ncbi:MAG: DNA primase [Phycisphaeraceae bacterium]
MSTSGNNDRENVLAATDLVRLIGEHVQLRPKGREFAGLCPFHDDKNPSMQVSPQKQIYKCFSCGAGGTAYDFVMGYHKLTFPEALKMLADRAGIELTPLKGRGRGAQGQGESKSGDRRKRLLSVNELAVAYYQDQLASPVGEPARAYLAQRGVSDEMVERFQLGYAPHSWHALAEAVAEKRWDKPAFEAAGLIAQGSKGLYDKLRHRLIFPICDDAGRAIAFGGRTLPGNELDDPTVDAKYLNSPETLLFNKSRTLYGLDLAKRAIIQSKTAVIVEGYTDVIACHQHGRENVIAALGTAFTNEHATKLRRLCEKVVLVFDGDAAGHKAADRAVEVFFASDIDVSVVILPQDSDPDEILSRENGVSDWDNLLLASKDCIEYQFSRLSERMHSTGTRSGKEEHVRQFVDRIVQIGFTDLAIERRAFLISRIAQVVNYPHSSIKQLVDRYLAKYRVAKERHRDFSDKTIEVSLGDRSSFALNMMRKAKAIAAEYVIACVVRDPNLFYEMGVDEELVPEELGGDHKNLYQIIAKRFEDDKPVNLQSILLVTSEVGLQEVANLLTGVDLKLDALLQDSQYSIKAILRSHIDALRHIRAEQNYINEKMKFLNADRMIGSIDEVAAKFFDYARRYFLEHPSPGRIYGHSPDTRVVGVTGSDDPSPHRISDESIRSALAG